MNNAYTISAQRIIQTQMDILKLQRIGLSNRLIIKFSDRLFLTIMRNKLDLTDKLQTIIRKYFQLINVIPIAILLLAMRRFLQQEMLTIIPQSQNQKRFSQIFQNNSKKIILTPSFSVPIFMQMSLVLPLISMLISSQSNGKIKEA